MGLLRLKSLNSPSRHNRVLVLSLTYDGPPDFDLVLDAMFLLVSRAVLVLFFSDAPAATMTLTLLRSGCNFPSRVLW